MEQTQRKAAFPDIFKYSFGGLGVQMTSTLVMSYLTFFYTDIFGVSSMAVAGLMLASRFIDAVTDPIMGMISDHTRSRFGRYRPWLMFAAPILGVIVFLLFSAPNLSPTMKLVYVYVVYISYSLASTAVNIPYYALTPVLSDDFYQRTVIIAWKSAMTQTGKFFVTVLALPLVNLFGGGAQGWAAYGALIGVLLTVSYWIAAWGSKPYDTMNLEIKKERVNFKSEIRLLVKNKPLLMLVIAYSTDMIANATLGAANMYFFKYVLHREDLVAVVGFALTATGIISIPLIPLISKKFGKKQTYWFTSLLSMIPLALMWINPHSSDWMLIAWMAVLGLISSVPSALGWAMLPDCVDYAEWKYGIRGNGLVSSAFTFCNKMGSALGGFFTSFLLGLVGFVANQEQTEIVLGAILFLRFGVPILGYIASVISMSFYELTDTRYAEILNELNEKRGVAQK